MKLCIFVSNALKKDPRVIKQIRCALKENIQVYFIGYRDKFYDKEFLDGVGCNVSIVDLGEDYVGPLKSVFKKIYRRLMFFFMPIKIMIKIKPDLIHANDFDTLVQAYIVSKLCRCKVIYDSHEICAENIGISNKVLQKNIIIATERFLVKRIGAMISVSNAAAEYFSKKYGIPVPIVITNCPYKSVVPISEVKDMDNFEALYQGLMLEGRGYEEFVKAGKFINKEITLVIRGYGPIEDSLKEIINDDQLSDNVRFDGPVEIQDIISKASESHIGVVLTQPVNINFALTVSNKIFEYMQAGLPVLISDIPEHRHLNKLFNFGVVVKDFTPKGIAKCINDLSIDQTTYNLLRANSIRAAEIMCWENESTKLIDLYRTLSPTTF